MHANRNIKNTYREGEGNTFALISIKHMNKYFPLLKTNKIYFQPNNLATRKRDMPNNVLDN